MAKAPEGGSTAADLGRRLKRCRRPRASRPSPCPSQPARRSPMHGEPPRWTAGSSTPSRLRPRCARPTPPPTPVPAASTPPVATPVPSGTHRQRRPQPLERTTRTSAPKTIVHTVPVPGGPPPGSSDHPPKPPRHGRLPVPALVAIAAVVLLGGAALAFALLSGGGGGEDLSPGGPPGRWAEAVVSEEDEARAMRVAVPAADPTTSGARGRPRRPACTSSSWRRTSRARCS